ncbi:MAG: aldehyde dehydrogenase family protein [Bacteroidota bacterium]|nr:aldehyde dehydrogenase family protein [Bacteroidota bacterium]
MLSYNRVYINGQWGSADGSERIAVINPATEAVVGEVPAGTVGDIDQAVQAARAALPSWSLTSPQVRVGYLKQIHQELVARAPEIAELITDELGMPIKLSQRIQAGLPALVTNSYVDLLETYEFSDHIGHSLVLKERIQTGQVDINGGRFNLQAPFGGYKQSGNGRELGRYGLEQFLHVKAVQY